MTLKPATADHLAQLLAAACANNEKVERVDLGLLGRVVQYSPEDMTVTAEAGMTLAALQTELARHRQWLPVDPPQPERLTLGELINANPSGPRRFGCGTVRDWLIGITVVLADGTLIHSGGKVVKNVAGYDLAKLFIGSRGSLGIVIETTFKLRPLPESEQFTQAQCETLEQAEKLIEAVMKSEITPVVIDLHNYQRLSLILGFAGTREEVEWQLARATELGFDQPSSLDYDAQFWADPTPAQRLSVLPSTMIEAIRSLNGAAFVARAGNGIIYHRGQPSLRRDELPLELMRRLKDTYDPRHILPELPL